MGIFAQKKHGLVELDCDIALPAGKGLSVEMQRLDNPWRCEGLPEAVLAGAPRPSVNAGAVRDMPARCPAAAPLLRVSGLGLDLWINAPSAAYLIAHAAAATGAEDMSRARAMMARRDLGTFLQTPEPGQIMVH